MLLLAANFLPVSCCLRESPGGNSFDEPFWCMAASATSKCQLLLQPKPSKPQGIVSGVTQVILIGPIHDPSYKKSPARPDLYGPVIYESADSSQSVQQAPPRHSVPVPSRSGSQHQRWGSPVVADPSKLRRVPPTLVAKVLDQRGGLPAAPHVRLHTASATSST
jgi:hypothetical protein